MAKTLYLDCYSGIAGDMTLAALIDLGADLERIKAELKKLPIDPFEIKVEHVVKQGISAKYLRIDVSESHHHHHSHGHHHGHDHHAHLHDHRHEHAHSHDHGHEHHQHKTTHIHAHIHDCQEEHVHHYDHAHHAHSHDDEHEHGHEHHHHRHTHTHEHHHDGHTHSHEHHHDGHTHSHEHHHDHAHMHAHHHDHVHRKAADIIAMIEASALPPRVKQRSTKIFRVIAEAEGKIHGMPPEDVHFHEVGAMDSIIDIIGVCIALELLEIDEIIASPVPTGYGRIKIAHGLYPIPAPATLELLKGIPLSGLQAEGELTTPTGAGILQALCSRFGPLPAMQVVRIGYGAGKKDFAHPNVLRAVLLEEPHTHTAGQAHGEQETREPLIVMEAQMDDYSGEQFGYLMERLFEAGALDVYYTPVYMKKNRPATLVTVLARPQDADVCESLLLTETSTLGVRRSHWMRQALGRRWVTVSTKYGEIRVKQALRNGNVVHSSPEYEDAVKAARQHQVPLPNIYYEVIRNTKE